MKGHRYQFVCYLWTLPIRNQLVVVRRYNYISYNYVVAAIGVIKISTQLRVQCAHLNSNFYIVLLLCI